ncbi:hypothetical protein [Nonomuraea sp. NPDC001023]|uniref:hypothetical protein n=1 Tax=unclassified Nonomuraea TaxID=2593643 RepID=UPI00331E0AAD
MSLLGLASAAAVADSGMDELDVIDLCGRLSAHCLLTLTGDTVLIDPLLRTVLAQASS